MFGWLSHRPLRWQLTAAFASSSAVVLVLAGVLILAGAVRILDQQVTERLDTAQAALSDIATDPDDDPQTVVGYTAERWVQLYDREGRVLAESPLVDGRALAAPAEVERARRGTITVTTELAGVDYPLPVRVFAIKGDRVAAVSALGQVRENTLERLTLLLALTMTGALALATAAGWQVAGRALRPVDAMRAHAAQLAAGTTRGRLPEPGTGDELQRLAATLNTLLDAQQDALERERRIVADASHELRTPVSVLRTRLDVALRGPQDAGALREHLEEAGQDAVRLSRLADDLLLLARADQGRLPLRLAPLDLDELLSDVQRRHSAAFGEAGRSLEITMPPSATVALADPDRALQLLDNLVTNALHHGAGAVSISAEPDDENQERVAILVRDHGPGFAAGIEGHWFERFSQAPEADHRGSGLGLAIVDALARAHGGTAFASNAAGGGAQVRITLPLA